MTVENCKRLLAHYEYVKNPTSVDKLGKSYSDQARINAKRAYEDMKKNLLARGESIKEEKPKK